MARFSLVFMLDGESLKSWLAQILGDYPSTVCARRFLPGACHVVLMMCESALLLYYMFLPSLPFVFSRAHSDLSLRQGCVYVQKKSLRAILDSYVREMLGK